MVVQATLLFCVDTWVISPRIWETDPWRVPAQIGPPDRGNASEALHDRQVGLPTAGHGKEGSGFGVGGDVRPPTSEYHRPLYRNLSDTGAMSDGRSTDGSVGNLSVVGTVWT